MTPEERDRSRLLNVDPVLVAAYFTIAAKFTKIGGGRLTVPPMGGYRTPSMQASTHTSGASGYDGGMSFSKHQTFPSHALDFMVIDAQGHLIVDGKDPTYTWVGEQFEILNYTWGGRFSRPDYDHIEIKGFQPNREQVMAGYAEFLRGPGGSVQA